MSSKPTSPVIPPSSASATTDEIKADMTVVSNLKELEASFSHMVVKVKRLLVLNKCDLSDALLFLDSFIGTEDFIRCNQLSVNKMQATASARRNISISNNSRPVQFTDQSNANAGFLSVFNFYQESQSCDSYTNSLLDQTEN